MRLEAEFRSKLKKLDLYAVQYNREVTYGTCIKDTFVKKVSIILEYMCEQPPNATLLCFNPINTESAKNIFLNGEKIKRFQSRKH